jgi:hypothetical protein
MADTPESTGTEGMPAPDASATVVEPVAEATSAGPALPAAVLSDVPATETPAGGKEAETAAAPAAGETPAGQEAPPGETPAPSDAAPAAEPVAYADFTFPEGAAADAELVRGASELFAADRLPQERAQTYVDYLHNVILPRWAEQQRTEGDRVFRAQITAFQQEFDASPLGGNRRDTTLSEAREAMRWFAGNDEQRARAYAVGQGSGAFNHPDIIRPLAGAGRFVADVMALTQAQTPEEALQRLREPNRPAPPLAPRATPTGTAAERRYGPTRR